VNVRSRQAAPTAAATCLRGTTGCPAMTTRVQAFPCPSAYFTCNANLTPSCVHGPQSPCID
jgi:hypothetical protein